MTTPIHDALAARDAAFAQLDNTDWRDETKDILRAILETAVEHDTFSANQARPHLPEGVATARIGRAFALAAQHGWIHPVGREISGLRSTHGKRIDRWRLTLVGAEHVADGAA